MGRQTLKDRCLPPCHLGQLLRPQPPQNTCQECSIVPFHTRKFLLLSFPRPCNKCGSHKRRELFPTPPCFQLLGEKFIFAVTNFCKRPRPMKIFWHEIFWHKNLTQNFPDLRYTVVSKIMRSSVHMYSICVLMVSYNSMYLPVAKSTVSHCPCVKGIHYNAQVHEILPSCSWHHLLFTPWLQTLVGDC